MTVRAFPLIRYFIISVARTRTFYAIIALVLFTVAFMAVLSYGATDFTGFSSIGYLMNRVSGVEKLNLIYFIWSIPFQILAVIISIMVSSGLYASDYENGEAAIYYSYPVSWSYTFMSKLVAAILVVMIPVALFMVSENAILIVYFHSMPPISMLYSLIMTVVSVVSVISVTALISVILKNSLMTALISLILYYVIMNIVNIYSVFTGGNVPVFILSNEVNAISQSFSMINLIPFGSSGSVGPADTLLMLQDLAYMGLYSCAALFTSLVILNGRDAA